MESTHLFSLGKITPQTQRPGGSRADAWQTNLPALQGMALSLLTLEPKGVREPHWHPNANELGYCLEGSALMTIFSPGANHDTFTIRAGELIFVPRGCMHHIENIGTTIFKILICYDNDMPEDMDLSAGTAAMPDHIMAKTFQLNSDFFKGLKEEETDRFITLRNKATVPPLPYLTGRFKFAIEAEHPQIENKGGWVKMSNRFLLPTLEGLAMYSLLLTPGGAREPHWHPNADELNYLISGQARITLFSPDGTSDSFDMQPGDLSFMPRGYLHYIESIGNENARFAIFFNHVAPSDLGFSGCYGAFSNEVLASVFGKDVNYFTSLPKFQEDLLIISGGG